MRCKTTVKLFRFSASGVKNDPLQCVRIIIMARRVSIWCTAKVLDNPREIGETAGALEGSPTLYEELDVERNRSRPPSFVNTLTELPRALLELGHLYTALPSLSLAARGDKHPLLLVPGFMAGDASLGLLRRYLRYLGYRPETWGFGRNMGSPEHLFDHLPERLADMADKAGEPVSLIGQSLGGVFSRELAREYPDLIRQVITLGSPFRISGSANTVRGLSHLFQVSSGRSVDEVIAMLRDRDFHQSPDVPLTAIYSKGDGVVHWESCREEEQDHHTQNIRVPGSHCGMGFNSVIYYIIADRLSQKVDAWQKFDIAGCLWNSTTA